MRAQQWQVMASLMPNREMTCAQCQHAQRVLGRTPLPWFALWTLARDCCLVVGAATVVLGLVVAGFVRPGFVPLAAAACLAVVLVGWKYGADTWRRMAECRYVVFNGVEVSHPYDSTHGVHWHLLVLRGAHDTGAVQKIGGLLTRRAYDAEVNSIRMVFLSDWTGLRMTLLAANPYSLRWHHWPDVTVSGDPDLVVRCFRGETQSLAMVFNPKPASLQVVEDR